MPTVQRRLVGATLLVLGMLILLFEPVGRTGGCADFHGGCRDFSSDSWWGLVHWPPGWYKLFVPLLIVGVALLVGGIVLIKASRGRRPDRTRARTTTLVLLATLSLAACTSDSSPNPHPDYVPVSRREVKWVILGPGHGNSLMFEHRWRFNGTYPLSLILDAIPSRLPSPRCPATVADGGLKIGLLGGRETVYATKCSKPQGIRRLLAEIWTAADGFERW
jgi:hypothetical protein